METKRPNFFDIAIGVAVASNGRQPPEDADEAADYLTEVLNQAFANTGVRAEVQPMAYPRSCKFPMLITLNGKKCRLLWYYPHLPADALSSELADLLSDVAVRTACVPAWEEAWKVRTSHREIRKRILEEKSKITDEEFFSSKEYRG